MKVNKFFGLQRVPDDDAVQMPKKPKQLLPASTPSPSPGQQDKKKKNKQKQRDDDGMDE